MTAEKYADQVIKKIKCGKEKKKDVRLQLIAEIEERVSDGELFDDVIVSMGSIEEVAQSFNENMSPKELAKYKKNRLMKLLGIIAAVLVVIVLAGRFFLPVSKPIENSKVFTKEQVEEKTAVVINMLDAEDYDGLKEISTEQMKSVVKHDVMDSAKAGIATDWGEQVSVGTMYIAEVSQMGKKMAVCQVQVAYENTSVTYLITFDRDMQLAGLYMK